MRERPGGEGLTPAAVLDFWFGELTHEDWFRGGARVDRMVADRFAGPAADAAAGRLDHWADTADGALALVLLLDQFPRNLHRDSAGAFAQDAKARAVADAALARGFDRAVAAARRPFLYLPFEHSEALADQDRSVALFAAHGDAEMLDYAERHRAVIARFGRFPHRNPVLGRTPTAEDTAYLAGRDEPF
ncbi:MAG: DUF924 family protein [Alphaproteobacteria bacterium]